MVAAGGAEAAAAASGGSVLQRYVRNPLLLDGYKSEVRVYFVVASLSPLTVLWHRHGSVRLAVAPFEHADYNTTLIHVLNTAAGKRALGAEAFKAHVGEGHKWTFDDLAAHLGRERWVAVEAKMRAAIDATMRAIASELAAPAGSAEAAAGWHTFGLFGADFIIDDTLKPWLIELQEGPGLSHEGDKVKETFVPTMVAQAAQIGVEAAVRRRTGASLDAVEAGTNFEPIA